MIVVDVEASGTEPAVHSLVAIGAIDFAQPARRFYQECRIWDGAHSMDESLDVCGFTHEQITDPAKPTEAEVVHAFIAWASEADDRTFAGQNVSFDRDFIKAAARRAGHTDWPFAYRTIDTHSLAWLHMTLNRIQPPHAHGHSALDLDAIAAYCGIPAEPEPHNALSGAMVHAEVISRLAYGRPLLPEFLHYPVPWEGGQHATL